MATLLASGCSNPDEPRLGVEPATAGEINQETPMTFEQFQATTKWSNDLRRDLPDGTWENDDKPAPRGFIYCDALYIERVTRHWGVSAQQRGTWCLVIGNYQMISNDLDRLEGALYEYAASELDNP